MTYKPNTISIVNVVVCYNNVSEIKQYINELESLNEASHVMLVVVGNDNSCEEDFQEEINNSSIVVKYVKSPGNIGYMKGAIWGYQHTSDINPQWYIVSNADISYPQKSFISKLLSKKYDRVCCIGPDTYVPESGEHQNPGVLNRFKKIHLLKYRFIFSNKITGWIYLFLSKIKKKYKNFKKDSFSKNVYLVHGAYMIFTQDLMAAMSKKKFEPFLYNEELYVAEMARLLNKNVYYDSELQVIHNEHSVTGKMNVEKKVRYMFESYNWIYRTFFKREKCIL